MPAKDTETIAAWYDALAKNYDELYGGEQSKKHAKVLQLLGDKEFSVIVDVGCGTGKLLELVSSRTRVRLGIDLSIQMLTQAKHRTAENNIQFVQADASHLPLRDQVANRVISISMTESGPVSSEHFSELSRIATKEATLIVTIFDDKNQTSSKQLNETEMELIATFSNRERLYAVNRAKHRARLSSESSALV